MKTQLEKNLDLILEEKITKIIPDNIKKGVKILGVEGNYGAGIFDPITIELSEIGATYSAKLSNPDANYGNSDHMVVDGSNDWIYRAYLKYDIDKFIGKNIKVVEAKLKFYIEDIDWGDYASQSDVFVAAATSNWNEKTLTWNNQPAKPAYIDEQKTPSVTNPQKNTWRTVDVTDIVQKWFSGLGNTGICLSAKTEGQYRRQWGLFNRRRTGYATTLTVTFQNETHVDTLDATATSSDLLMGKTAYAINEKITGSMPNNGATTITPSTTEETIPLGYHNGQGKVVGDKNLIPNNILKGKSIFGVDGNLDLETLKELDVIKVEYPSTSTVSYYFTDDTGAKINEIEQNKYLITSDTIHCITNNDGLIRNDVLNIESSSDLTIIIPKNNGMLSSHYDDNTAGLLGSVRTVQTTTSGSLTYASVAGYKGIKTNGDGNTYVRYNLGSSISNYTVEFDFYKADTAAFSRVCYLYGAEFEIEIKGASNNIYWGTDYQAGWKQNAWNNLKLVKSGSNVSLYMNGKLIATRTYSGALTGLIIGRGSSSGNAMNAYYRNLIIKDNSVVVPNNEYIITPKYEDLQEQLDNQDRIIVELQNALENKSGGCIILDVTENDNVKVEDEILVISKGSKLPNEYQEVEYIESTGTQYINTGLIGSQDVETKMKFQISKTPTTAIALLGCWNSNAMYRIYYNFPSSSIKVQYHKNTVDTEYNPLNEISTLTLFRNNLIINGRIINITDDGDSFDSEKNILLFASQSTSVEWENDGNLRIYNAKFYSIATNDVLRDLVPCYRKSDNVIGLYDLIHDVFYTNQGTGTFLKGADV